MWGNAVKHLKLKTLHFEKCVINLMLMVLKSTVPDQTGFCMSIFGKISSLNQNDKYIPGYLQHVLNLIHKVK